MLSLLYRVMLNNPLTRWCICHYFRKMLCGSHDLHESYSIACSRNGHAMYTLFLPHGTRYSLLYLARNIILHNMRWRARTALLLYITSYSVVRSQDGAYAIFLQCSGLNYLRIILHSTHEVLVHTLRFSLCIYIRRTP